MDNVPVLVAIIAGVGGILTGVAALRRAGAEADEHSAGATGVLLGGATSVVTLLRQQMDEQAESIRATSRRLEALEIAVGQWEGWAERVLDLLDRALSMLESEQQAHLQAEVEEAKRTRPVHHRSIQGGT